MKVLDAFDGVNVLKLSLLFKIEKKSSKNFKLSCHCYHQSKRGGAKR